MSFQFGQREWSTHHLLTLPTACNAVKHKHHNILWISFQDRIISHPRRKTDLSGHTDLD